MLWSAYLFHPAFKCTGLLACTCILLRGRIAGMGKAVAHSCAAAPRSCCCAPMVETNRINIIEHKATCSCGCMTRAMALFALLLATAAMSAAFAQQQQVQA